MEPRTEGGWERTRRCQPSHEDTDAEISEETVFTAVSVMQMCGPDVVGVCVWKDTEL